jgi:hypothetical protein
VPVHPCRPALLLSTIPGGGASGEGWAGGDAERPVEVGRRRAQPAGGGAASLARLGAGRARRARVRPDAGEAKLRPGELGAAVWRRGELGAAAVEVWWLARAPTSFSRAQASSSQAETMRAVGAGACRRRPAAEPCRLHWLAAEVGRLGEGAGGRMRRGRRGEGASGAWPDGGEGWSAGGGGWPAGGGAGATRGRWPPTVLGLIWGGWGIGKERVFFIFLDI